MAFALAAALLIVLYWLRNIILLTFLAVILGILLDSIAAGGTRFLRLPRSVAVVLAAIVVLASVAGALALIAFPLVREGTEFVKELPEKVAGVERRLERYREEFPWLERLWPRNQSGSQPNPGQAPQIAKKALFSISAALEGASTALAVFFLGLFLAWDPERWLRGVVDLWPGTPRQDRAQLLRRIGSGLRSYLFTLALYIVVMGGAWALGLWLIGIEYPLLLGAIGGLAEVVPYVGPFIGLIPPLLLALSGGLTKVLAVVGLYIVLHIVEGYILVPYVMQRQEHLPPPVVVLSILAFGSLFGVLGVVLAVPLGTAAYIWVNETVYKKNESTQTKKQAALTNQSRLSSP